MWTTTVILHFQQFSVTKLQFSIVYSFSEILVECLPHLDRLSDRQFSKRFGVAKFDKKQPLVIYGDDVRDASVLAEGHGYLKKYLKFEKVQVIIASKNDSHCHKFVYLMFHGDTRTQIGLAVG